MKLIFRVNSILVILGFIAVAITGILTVILGISVISKNVEQTIAVMPWFLWSATITTGICIVGLMIANKIEKDMKKESG